MNRIKREEIKLKILLITSGFKGIYTFFEDNVIKSLKNLGNECEPFTEYKNLEKFRREIQIFKPDLILVMIGVKMSKPLLEYIKQSHINSAVWMTEDPFYMDWTIPLCDYFDYIFTIDTAALAYYKKIGHSCVYYLPLGTDPDLYCFHNVSEEYVSDICLVGVPYTNRIQLIELLLLNTDFQIQLVGRGWGKYHKKWKKNPKIKHKLNLVNAWVTPETAVNYYNGSKIILNIHRPSDEKYNRNSTGIISQSINNRTFDTASCETFQLIDYKEDLAIHFKEGKEIVSFQDKEDLFEKIQYYIKNEEERKQIAKNARKRVLADHTFQHRMDYFLKIIQSQLESNCLDYPPF